MLVTQKNSGLILIKGIIFNTADVFFAVSAVAEALFGFSVIGAFR